MFFNVFEMLSKRKVAIMSDKDCKPMKKKKSLGQWIKYYVEEIMSLFALILLLVFILVLCVVFNPFVCF